MGVICCTFVCMCNVCVRMCTVCVYKSAILCLRPGLGILIMALQANNSLTL